jgi:uncharacterized LabA/DUF88 family protein
MRANVYVDGFNLFYGCLKKSPYRWLNIAKLADELIKQHRVNKIHYFTAIVRPLPDNPDQPIRQQVYLRALKTLPNVTVHFGRYQLSKVYMPLVDPPAGQRHAHVFKMEEKGSDVNLATQLLMDAFDDDFDVAGIVSGDSDLVKPISVVRDRFKKPVGVFFSPNRESVELRKAASFRGRIDDGKLHRAQFPASVLDGEKVITRPTRWDPVALAPGVR